MSQTVRLSSLADFQTVVNRVQPSLLMLISGLENQAVREPARNLHCEISYSRSTSVKPSGFKFIMLRAPENLLIIPKMFLFEDNSTLRHLQQNYFGT